MLDRACLAEPELDGASSPFAVLFVIFLAQMRSEAKTTKQAESAIIELVPFFLFMEQD